jgi:hypothetical protein
MIDSRKFETNSKIFRILQLLQKIHSKLRQNRKIIDQALSKEYRIYLK